MTETLTNLLQLSSHWQPFTGIWVYSTSDFCITTLTDVLLNCFTQVLE